MATYINFPKQCSTLKSNQKKAPAEIIALLEKINEELLIFIMENRLMFKYNPIIQLIKMLANVVWLWVIRMYNIKWNKSTLISIFQGKHGKNNNLNKMMISVKLWKYLRNELIQLRCLHKLVTEIRERGGRRRYRLRRIRMRDRWVMNLNTKVKILLTS